MTTRGFSLPVETTVRERLRMRLAELADIGRVVRSFRAGVPPEVVKGFGTQLARTLIGGELAAGRPKEELPFFAPARFEPVRRFEEKTRVPRTGMEATGRLLAGGLGAFEPIGLPELEAMGPLGWPLAFPPGVPIFGAPAGGFRAAARALAGEARAVPGAVERAVGRPVLPATRRAVAARPVGEAIRGPAAQDVLDVDVQIKKLTRAVAAAREAGAPTREIDATLQMMRQTRRNLFESVLPEEEFARLGELETLIPEAQAELEATKSATRARPPHFGTLERAEFDNLRRLASEAGRPIRSRKQELRDATMKLRRLQDEYREITRLEPEEVVAPITGRAAVQPGLLPGRAAQIEMLPDLQGRAERVGMPTAEELLERQRARPLPGQMGFEGQVVGAPPPPAPAAAAPPPPRPPVAPARAAALPEQLPAAERLQRGIAALSQYEARGALSQGATARLRAMERELAALEGVPPSAPEAIPPVVAEVPREAPVPPPSQVPPPRAEVPGPPPPPVPPAPPAVPPPIPPQAVGRTYVGDLRPFKDDMAEVVTSNNPVVRWVAGHTGVNPSLLGEGEEGRALVAYYRQRLEAEQLIESALSALDAQAQRFTGRQRGLPINAEGFFGRMGKLWNDVFSTPGAYTLSKESQEYIRVFRQIVDEAEAFRVLEGLKPLARRGPEGWFYVPRQVKGIRGVELRRPSSPRLQRLYDEATDGFARGVKYDADPRATLDLHLRTHFQEAIEKRLSDVLEPLSITPKELIPRPIVTRLQDAIRALRGAERDARRSFQAQARQAGKAPMPSTFQVHVRQSPAVVDSRARYLQAKTAYTRAMESARRAETAPGHLFGKEQETIAIGQWRNRFFPREKADQLREGLASIGVTGKFERLANTIRTGASVMDVAAPWLQGLPVLGRNPIGWAKATARHYWTILEPTARARYLEANRRVVQEMASYGIPISETEFFQGARLGQGLPLGAPLERVPMVGPALRGALRQVGKQTYGRFQESYSAFLLVARMELWKAWSKGAANKAEVAARIRNMTGGLESRALGVGPTQRAVEATWIAFSPKYLRSTLAIFEKAVHLDKAEGREAARTLAQTAGAAVAIYIATGMALGKSQEEITAGLDPLGGKKFLSHNVNGDWIGVGGQVYAIARMLYELVSLPWPGGKPAGDILSLSRYENPLIAFGAGRAAVGQSIVMAIGEGVTGRNLAYGVEVHTIPDLIKHIGTRAIPFVAQNLLEGQEVLSLVMGAAGPLIRTSPPTKAELKKRKPSIRVFRGTKPGSIQVFRGDQPGGQPVRIYRGPVPSMPGVSP